MLIFNIFLLVP